MASGDMALGDTHGILAWHALHLRHLAAFCVASGRFLCGRRGIYGTGPRNFVTHDVQLAICEAGMALAALRWMGWTALVAVALRRFYKWEGAFAWLAPRLAGWPWLLVF